MMTNEEYREAFHKISERAIKVRTRSGLTPQMLTALELVRDLAILMRNRVQDAALREESKRDQLENG